MQQPAAAMAPPAPAPSDPNQQYPQPYQMAPAPPQPWMMPQQQQAPPQYYQPPPQQQAAPPQYYQPPPMWGPQASQIPPPQPLPPPQAQGQGQGQVQYQAQPVPQAAAPPPAADEIRTLWIGNLQPWMNETYINACFGTVAEVWSVKLIRNKQTQQPEGYGFIEFSSRAIAEQVLQTYNGQMMPNAEQTFRLNWATLSAGDRREDTPDYTIFVGDLASDVTDYLLQETFKVLYPSVKGANVVIDRTSGRSKGYGFVKFGDPSEQARAVTEMNGMLCSTRPMRIGTAATKKSGFGPQQYTAKASYQSTPGTQSENDPNNTTIFVGGLDPEVGEDSLREIFSHYGELMHVKIPVGKRCGFVQFANRSSAEQALNALNGFQLGGYNIRLSWGRTPNKQPQQDPNQWNGNYYGYGQQNEAYAYAQPSQDPNMYAYGSYPGYGNYQQQQVNVRV